MGRLKKRVVVSVLAGRPDSVIELGGRKFHCALLPEFVRVLRQADVLAAVGCDRPDVLLKILDLLSRTGINARGLISDVRNPLLYVHAGATDVTRGYPVWVLTQLVDTIASAATGNLLPARYNDVVRAVRDLAPTLRETQLVVAVDTAVGYAAPDRPGEQMVNEEPDRTRGVRLFPDDFYENLYRLRGLAKPYPGPMERPAYIGTLTRQLVYERLPAGVWDELKATAPKGSTWRHTRKLFTFLTDEGRRLLRDHIDLVVRTMEGCKTYPELVAKLDAIRPRRK